MVIFIFLILHWYLSLFSQTFFLHRYAAHSMFSMSRGWERFFYIFTWITQGSSYLSPYAYGLLHRLHHAHTDTPDDPHSPKYEKGLISLMLKTWRIYTSINEDKIEVEDKYRKNLPTWRSFDKVMGHDLVRLGWVGVYILFYLIFAEAWWMYLLIPIHCLMGPIHGAVINYFAHKYGYRNFDMDDTSKNFLPVDLIMMGESYHNNHHKYISRPNFGWRWFEIDPTYPIIRLLDSLKIIRLTKTAA